MRLRAELKKLVREECASYDHGHAGHCLLETKPDCTACPFFNGADDVLPRCKYFERSVLPVNEPLDYRYKQAIGAVTDGKICSACKQPFSPRSNSAKYCSSCADRVRHQQKARQSTRYRKNRKNEA
ncbi:MAG: cysteine-rich VLP protein [Sporolactobacillus sp.]